MARTASKPTVGIPRLLLGCHDVTQWPRAREQLRRHRRRRHDLEALAFEEAHDAAQEVVVAAGGNEAQDRRKAEEEAEIRPQGPEIRPGAPPRR